MAAENFERLGVAVVEHEHVIDRILDDAGELTLAPGHLLESYGPTVANVLPLMAHCLRRFAPKTPGMLCKLDLGNGLPCFLDNGSFGGWTLLPRCIIGLLSIGITNTTTPMLLR